MPKLPDSSENSMGTTTDTDGAVEVYTKPTIEADLAIISAPETLSRVFSDKERQRFIDRAAQLLFTSEFVTPLALYTKFVVPFIFGKCRSSVL